MIDVLVVIALMAMPCKSDVVQADHETIATRCDMPEIQGPPPPPTGWVAPQVEKPKVVKKKKHRKRKRRHG